MKQTDIYTEALVCLRLILQTDTRNSKTGSTGWGGILRIGPSGGRSPPSFSIRRNGFFQRSANMRGNHDYIFDFLKSVCYTFGHRNGKRQGISPEALMEECVHDAEQASYHPHKGLNRAIAQHLMQGNLQDNLDRL